MKVMRALKIVLTSLAAGVLVISLASCTKSTSSTGTQTATVQRGDLSVSITGSGNLALSRTADLAFEMAGTVQEVLVEEGDSVTEGQVLASLDTDEWEGTLTDLEDALTKAQRAIPQAKITLADAETALEEAEAQSVWPNDIFQARAQVYAAEADVAEAQAMLQGTKLVYDRDTGQYYYQQALTAYDIKVWTQTLSDAQAKLASAQLALDKLLKEYAIETKIAYAQENLKEAQAALDKLLEESPVNASEVAVQKQKVDLAQQALEDAQNASKDIAKKKLQVQIAQDQLEDDQKAVADAQKALDEAKSKSPVIKAPFDGFVTAVNVKGGDDVLKGTVALQIADPNKFEADITVSEMDISQVKVGQTATVEADALSGVTLSANVTHIAPTATIQSGVVNYKVTVEVGSTPTVTTAKTTTDNATSQGTQGFTPPAGFTPPTGFTPPEGMTTTPGQSSQVPSQITSTVTQNIQLKEGMTVIVSIIVQQRSNVLLVPNGAITSQGGQSYVQVVSSSGATEQRAIKTDITDDVNTEVTSGLSEGEKVVVSKATTTTSTTSTSTQQQGPGGGMMIPGVGGP
jgi:HlyD family secretion protein